MSVAPPPTLADRIDAWLPQTQCTRCGYPRCRDYAEAVAAGQVDINRCPPGGDVTLHGLATLLAVPLKPLDPECGPRQPRTLAVIGEAVCIGCRKCIDVCPVDAIVGAPKHMHTVIAGECNGCGLCVPPCPVDCIAMNAVTPIGTGPWPDYSAAEAERWRTRTASRQQRLKRRDKKKPSHRRVAQRAGSIFPDRETIRADIRAAVERAKRNKARHIGRARD